VEQILRVHDGQTLVVDQPVGPENVERELVGVRATLAIPLLVDDFGVAVGVEAKSLVRRWDDISEDFAPDFGWDPEQWRVIVQGGYCLWNRDLFKNRLYGVRPRRAVDVLCA
jgi:hypothetical protein